MAETSAPYGLSFVGAELIVSGEIEDSCFCFIPLDLEPGFVAACGPTSQFR
jgi:hypothetical protein